MTLLYRKIARRIPGLNLKLRQAKMPDTPEYYVQKTFLTSIMVTIAIILIAFFLLKTIKVILILPFIFVFAFLYYIRYVDIRIDKLRTGINREIIYAGRFLIIELESGVPMYDAFENIGKNYDIIGRYFEEIIAKVDLGTTLEEAMNETITITPSPELRKVLWQVLNSLKTGSDIKNSLTSVIDQIVREQKIAVSEYGRKLNPLAMFYMMIAVIVPSLGIVMLIVLCSFLGFNMPLVFLLVISGIIGFVQFMFMAVIKSQRPPVEF